MIAGDIIEFSRKKQFKYMNELGSGGTGDTHLFLDDTTDMYFAIKKYSPKDEQYIDEFYRRFVDEIKILFNLSHSNIVRIYNYYLYPEKKLGYLQMEYIDGTQIDKYYAKNLKEWETIFKEVISAFRYLEHNRILHRDIRPANMMIDKSGHVKVIDFGFGKMLGNDQTCADSVILNWPVSEYPEEIQLKGVYNNQTEIFFVGKLFKGLINDQEFAFNFVLDKMVKVSPAERYTSFEDIEQELSNGIIGELNFTYNQKNTYQVFADALTSHIVSYINKYVPAESYVQIEENLLKLIARSALEENIQDNRLLIRAFVKGGFRCVAKKDIKVHWLKDFYSFFVTLDNRKKNIVMDNIFLRLSAIRVDIDKDDELPF